MNPDHVYRDPQRGKGSGRLLRGEPESMANRRRSLTEISERRRLERAARDALDRCGWTAPTVVVSADLAGQGLKSTEIMSALQLVGEMRGQQDRPPTDEEIEMATKRTEQLRDEIRALLEEDATFTVPELEADFARRGIKTNTSFPVHVSAVRKELGIDGRAVTAAKAAAARATGADQSAESAAEVVHQDAAAGGDERDSVDQSEDLGPDVAHPTPARQPSEEAEAAQPPEVDDEQPSPTPPPAVPVAEDFTPAGVKIVRERLETELLRAQQRVREIRIAIEVVEGLVA